jgi:hypothetical protein
VSEVAQRNHPGNLHPDRGFILLKSLPTPEPQRCQQEIDAIPVMCGTCGELPRHDARNRTARPSLTDGITPAIPAASNLAVPLPTTPSHHRNEDPPGPVTLPAPHSGPAEAAESRSMPIALLHPIGHTGILHHVHDGKFDPRKPAELKSVEQSLTLGQGRAPPALAARSKNH